MIMNYKVFKTTTLCPTASVSHNIFTPTDCTKTRALLSEYPSSIHSSYNLVFKLIRIHNCCFLHILKWFTRFIIKKLEIYNKVEFSIPIGSLYNSRPYYATQGYT
jgi:hypothetical protein